eukprot:4144854-Pyramimonas_sp.AAC.2
MEVGFCDASHRACANRLGGASYSSNVQATHKSTCAMEQHHHPLWRTSHTRDHNRVHTYRRPSAPAPAHERDPIDLFAFVQSAGCAR